MLSSLDKQRDTAPHTDRDVTNNTGIHKDDFAGSPVRLRVHPVLATTFPKDHVHLLPIQTSL
jgi:hypothetical protein